MKSPITVPLENIDKQHEKIANLLSIHWVSLTNHGSRKMMYLWNLVSVVLSQTFLFGYKEKKMPLAIKYHQRDLTDSSWPQAELFWWPACVHQLNLGPLQCGVPPGEHWQLCSQPSWRQEGPSCLPLACTLASSLFPLTSWGAGVERADGILSLEDISQPWGPSKCPCERHLHRPTWACGVHRPNPKNLEALKQTWKTSKCLWKKLCHKD